MMMRLIVLLYASDNSLDCSVNPQKTEFLNMVIIWYKYPGSNWDHLLGRQRH